MPSIADLITLPIAILALGVAFLAFWDSRQYRRTVTKAQLAVKCQPNEDHKLEVLAVNVGVGIAYDVTFTEGSPNDITKGFPGWSLNLGDLLPNEQRVVMRLGSEELRTKPTSIVALRYRTERQYAYPNVRAKRSQLPDYQRTIDRRYWFSELEYARTGNYPDEDHSI